MNAQRTQLHVYFYKGKKLPEEHLVNALKIPVYKRFKELYKELFNKKITSDRQAIPLFQEKMIQFKNLPVEEINQEARSVVEKSMIGSYVTKLIKAVIEANHLTLVLSINGTVQENLVHRELPTSLMFFKVLFSELGDIFAREPSLFCDKDSCKLMQLKCVGEALEFIDISIRNVINKLTFTDQFLDPYIEAIEKTKEAVLLLEPEPENEPEEKDAPKDENDDKKEEKPAPIKETEDDEIDILDTSDDEDDDEKSISHPLPEELAIITYKDDQVDPKKFDSLNET